MNVLAIVLLDSSAEQYHPRLLDVEPESRLEALLAALLDMPRIDEIVVEGLALTIEDALRPVIRDGMERMLHNAAAAAASRVAEGPTL